MARYLEKEMDITTYAGTMGTQVLGDFSTASSTNRPERGLVRGQQLELGYEVPLEQNLNGVQMKMEPMIGELSIHFSRANHGNNGQH